jgi:hypothetical protein
LHRLSHKTFVSGNKKAQPLIHNAAPMFHAI